MVKKSLGFVLILIVLGACASKMKDQLKNFREAFILGDYEKAQESLEKSGLAKDSKAQLLWHLEGGTLDLAKNNLDSAVLHFQTSLDLIDKLFTTKLTSKAQSLLINDASDEFYGASYERSYAHYFLARSLYARYLKTGNKLDLQGARGTILSWDSYFTELQRSSTLQTLYHTDLMLKVFGGEIHEMSGINNDNQIALQLYKDALGILDREGGLFSLFNKKSAEFIKSVKDGKVDLKLYDKTQSYEDLKSFLQSKVANLSKGKSGNVVILVEEGLIPQKVGKPFNFGLKGAAGSVDDSGAKKFIMSVGLETLTLFAMNKLNMVPTQSSSRGSFLFAHNVTKLAVQEAAVEFELPMIENVPLVQRLELFILDDKGVVKIKLPLPVISDNGDIARVVLEEDVVSRYVKTGTRVATKHIMAIIAAYTIYKRLSGRDEGADFIAKSAALATYIASTKGIAALEKADTRAWVTLPQALRLAEITLAPGNYKAAVAYVAASTPDNIKPKAPMKVIGDVLVKNSGKSLHTFRFISPSP